MIRGRDDAKLQLQLEDVAKVWHQNVPAQAVGTGRSPGMMAVRPPAGDRATTAPPCAPGVAAADAAGCSAGMLWMTRLGATQHSEAAEVPHCAV